MMFGRNPREQVIEPVLEFMRRHRLGLDDLTDIGGEDLKSPIPTQRAMAARVSRCWELIARKGVNFAELAAAAGSMPASAPRRRRGDPNLKTPLKSLENPKTLNPNEINDLAISALVGPGRPECAR